MQPTRSCVVCRKKQDKTELFRLIAINNEIIHDKGQKISSRGIYFCKDKNCLDKAIKGINSGKLKFKIKLDKQSLLDNIIKLKNELGE